MILQRLKLLLFSLLLAGCSSQYHLRKAIKKDPTILQVDTILTSVIDTVITETIRKDTTFFISNDTTIIIKDRLTVRHFIHDSTVYIEAECLGDTIVKELIIETIVDRWIKPTDNWLKNNWLIILIAGAIAYILYKIR